MYTALLIILLSNGTMQAAVSPKPFPDMDSCVKANSTIEEMVKVDGYKDGIVGYHFDCLPVTKDTFKKVKAGQES